MPGIAAPQADHRHRHRHTVAAAIAIALAAPSGFAQGAHPTHRGEVADVATIAVLDPDGPYVKLWSPHLARWTDEHYVCAYAMQVRGKGDIGDIAVSVSTDRGRTWSPHALVFDHRDRSGAGQHAYANPVLFRPPGQDVVWLYAMRVPLHYRDSENADLVAAYTGDGGYSWHPVELSMDYQGPLVVVAGIQTVEREGVAHYLLPAHRNSRRHDPHGDRRQLVLESTSLVRWSLAGYVPYPEEAPVFLHEGKIAPGEQPGELTMVMRTATMDRERPIDPPLAYSSTSRDGGRSWSLARPEPALPNYRAKSFFGQDRHGTHIYVYDDRVERHGLYFKTRPPGGAWSEARVFYFDDDRNSYPTLVEDEAGDWLAVWDSSHGLERARTAIRFGRLAGAR